MTLWRRFSPIFVGGCVRRWKRSRPPRQAGKRSQRLQWKHSGFVDLLRTGRLSRNEVIRTFPARHREPLFVAWESAPALTPKAFDVLRYLVERADRLVTQEEILEALWPETYINPEGIRKYILEIRKVLGDQRRPPLFIETLPKRGYQFIARVADEQTFTPSRPPVKPTGISSAVTRHLRSSTTTLKRH